MREAPALGEVRTTSRGWAARAQAHCHALALPLVVLLRRHHAHDGHVALARPQVLPEREDLDASVEHVAASAGEGRE
eukprot:5227798-Prymnesium_polylepis.1